MDVWADAKAILGTVAPTLASALGGPLAGAAIGVLCKTLGLDQAAPEHVVAAAVAGADPGQKEALARADDEFMVTMAQLRLSRTVVAAGDVANARQMAVARKDWVPSALAILVVVGFFALVLVVTFVQVPEKSATTLNLLLGSLSGAFISVIGFYFGSSAGSAAKDKLLISNASFAK